MLLYVYFFLIKLKYVKEIWIYFNDIIFYIVLKDFIRYDWKFCILILWYIFCKFVRRVFKIYDVYIYINILFFKNIKILFVNYSRKFCSFIGIWWLRVWMEFIINFLVWEGGVFEYLRIEGFFCNIWLYIIYIWKMKLLKVIFWEFEYKESGMNYWYKLIEI